MLGSYISLTGINCPKTIPLYNNRIIMFQKMEIAMLLKIKISRERFLEVINIENAQN